MEVYTYAKDELEEVLDQAKALLLQDISKAGLMNYEQAEKYAETHTIIMKKKNLFRTLSDMWHKQKESSGYYLIVVNNEPKIGDDEKE